jgi:3-hydroxyacyl-CoA dehydrogenase
MRRVPGVVELRKDGDIAVIVIDNPPVNALKHEVRAGVLGALTRADTDTSVAAAVIGCAGRTFVAGADITEFDKPPQPPGLPDVIGFLDGMKKPVVAALFGTPLGGGLELALGCHYRVAAPGTRLGLPEIKLGLLPGAGGTQRLPRLVGMEKAMAMILSGDPIAAAESLKAGLIDEIADGDVTQAAIFLARNVATRRPLPRARDRQVKLDGSFESIAAPFVKRARGLDAPAAAIEALRGALTLPIDEGLRREREAFQRLRAGDQSKAQRHIFFAEREAAKVPGLPKEVKPREVKRAAVVGGGTMGGGIAMSFANAGIPVTLIETGKDALNRGVEKIAANYGASVARGSMSEDEKGRRLARIEGATDLAAAAAADLIVEAVFEEMDVKRAVFKKLDGIAKPDAILATNTSYLDVNALARTTRRSANVLGLHFFSPANVMRLLEIVRAEDTAPDVLASAIALARRIGKIPVTVGVCHGFVGNRMLRARSIEAERLLLEGALPQQVDAVLTEFGFPMGPFAMSDLAGLDISWRMRKAQGARAEIADQLCEMGRLGQKTSKGFYLYEPGSRTPKPDPDVAALIEAASQRLGIARRQIGHEEIVARLIYPMINEGARILEEGIASRPGDIDVIWVYGYGFPAWRGGPMFYADTIGVGEIRDCLKALAVSTGDARHQPAPLLERLASEGHGFAAPAT